MKYEINAVMFDLDGTLLDSEKIYSRCWMQAAKSYGYVMTREMSLELRSLDAQLAGQLFGIWYGREEIYPQVRQKRRELVSEVIQKDGVLPKTGAKEILDFMSESGIKTYIVTATARESAYNNLQSAGLKTDGINVISVTDVARGKPYPDVYEYACRQAEVEPQNVIVVEDSPNGIKSAFGAGCRVIMVPDLTEPEGALEDMIFKCKRDLNEVREYLQYLC